MTFAELCRLGSSSTLKERCSPSPPPPMRKRKITPHFLFHAPAGPGSGCAPSGNSTSFRSGTLLGGTGDLDHLYVETTSWCEPRACSCSCSCPLAGLFDSSLCCTIACETSVTVHRQLLQHDVWLVSLKTGTGRADGIRVLHLALPSCPRPRATAS